VAEKATTNERLLAAYQRLAERRLIVGAEGNVSERAAGGMLISVTGARAGEVGVESFVDCDLNGGHEAARKPSSEWAMHAAIYRNYPQAGAVVHTHSDACVALAVQQRPLPPFHYQVARFGAGDVRCTPYAQFASQELASLAVTALSGRTACLLGNHGMICYAGTVREAVDAAELLETLARQYLLACGSGTPRLLTESEVQGALARYGSYSPAADSAVKED